MLASLGGLGARVGHPSQQRPRISFLDHSWAPSSARSPSGPALARQAAHGWPGGALISPAATISPSGFRFSSMRAAASHSGCSVSPLSSGNKRPTVKGPGVLLIDRCSYTEADINLPMIGDAMAVADHIGSLRYHVVTTGHR